MCFLVSTLFSFGFCCYRVEPKNEGGRFWSINMGWNWYELVRVGEKGDLMGIMGCSGVE